MRHLLARAITHALLTATGLAALYVSPVSAAEAPPVTVDLITSDTEVQPNGLFTRTMHYEFRAMNDAAAAQIAQRAVSFSASLEQLDIVEAYTLKADGRKLAVNPNSILTQQPQGAVSIPQFDDQRQKVIIFPNVAGGDKVVFTARLRATRARIPGHFTYVDVFPPGNAFNEVRETIVAPKSFPLQTESHDVTFEKLETGNNVTYRWRYSSPNPTQDVTLPAVSPLDRLPRIFVSSLKNYEELGRVYGGMVAPKETVTNQIRTLADRVTAGITDRRGQAEALYNWVSKNIRYVAIDIGNGGIVPHDADSVLANGYGDCKDHTVLYAALLKARGIDSEVVLINSANAYTLPEVAALAPMDHAITWLPEFKMYVDTTAGTAPFGTLPFSEYGKPVVHAVSSGTVSARTPVLAPDAATTNVKTAARIDKDGNVTGDSSVTATGPFSAILRGVGIVVQANGSARVAAAQLQAQGFTGTGSYDVPPPLELGPNYTLTTHFSFGPETDRLTGQQMAMVRGISPGEAAGSFLMGPWEMVKEDEPTVCWSGRQTEEISLTGPEDKTFKTPPADVAIRTANLQFTARWSANKNTMTVRREFTSSVQEPLCTGDVRKETAKALAQIRDHYDKSFVSFVAPPGSANKAQSDLSAGIAAAKNGDIDEAIRLYSSALGQADIDRENQYWAYFDRGLAYTNKRAFQQAVDDLSKALEVKPNDVEAYKLRAGGYASLGQRDKAIADFNSAIAIKPDDPALFGARGSVYLEERKLQEATADYSTVIRLKPDEQLAYVGRASAYLARALLDREIADCDSAIRLGRKAPDCFGMRGFAYYLSARYEEALSGLSQGIQIQENAILFLNRGLTYLAIDKTAEAVADFNNAVRLFPNNAPALFARGIAKQKRGDQMGGDADLASARRINPNIATQMDSLGVISGLYEKGKDDLAGCESAEMFRSVTLGMVYCYRAAAAPTLNAADKAAARVTLGVIYANQLETDEAIAQYDAALHFDPRHAASLYARGVAKLKTGNTAEGNADIAAAKAIQANIEMQMAGRGITP